MVKTLFENICDKSKIHTSSGVVDIRLTATGVEVQTDNGAFQGDIVVGADGVHSRVRHVMEQLALANGDGELFQEKDSRYYPNPLSILSSYELTLYGRISV